MDSNTTYFLALGGMFGDNASLDEFDPGAGGGDASGLANSSLQRANFTCPPVDMPTTYTLFMVLYAVVCLVGVMGNTLVIYVVLRFSNMQTVTNMYILNLAIADECFLIGIPFLIATMHMKRWVFGGAMCKAYMVSTSITQFTSSIFLFIMSADRYIAICHHISSPKYRTPLVSRVVSALAWLVSALIMLPIMMYGQSIEVAPGSYSCHIVWPETHDLEGYTFTLYSLILGFVVPLCFIMTFYCLVIRKLRNVGPKTTNKSRGKRRSHRKVTKLVLTVITVYILCWLPYWISQVALISSPPKSCHTRLDIILFLLVGCMGYINSAINPILYAYLSENFKKSFLKACTCAARADVNAQLKLENSVMPKRSRTRTSSDTTQLTTSKVQHRLLIDPTTTATTTTTGASTVSSRNPSPPVVQRSLLNNNCTSNSNNHNNNNSSSNNVALVSSSENNAKNFNNEHRVMQASTNGHGTAASVTNNSSAATTAGELVQLS